LYIHDIIKKYNKISNQPFIVSSTSSIALFLAFPYSYGELQKALQNPV